MHNSADLIFGGIARDIFLLSSYAGLPRIFFAAGVLIFSTEYCILIQYRAGVLELADETDSKSVGGDTVWVRPPPPALKKER